MVKVILLGEAAGEHHVGITVTIEVGNRLIVAVAGKRRGQRVVRIGKGTRNEPNVLGVLCADLEGFSLHAAVRVAVRAAAGNRRQLEHLCRYAGRPTIAESCQRLLPDGRVA
ncbi:MAG: hypothetical protein ACJAYX_004839 [Planctomycetota bacterium]